MEIAPDGIWRLPATPADVDPDYLRLLLATEDKRFRVLPGVDPLALSRAAFQLVTHGRVVSGGSTLTMQVARLLAPHRHDMLGKLEDLLRALQLTERFSKTQILSMYLTLAPFGGNVEGVEAASLRYFGKRPVLLSPAERALLVALPRRPSALDPLRHPAAAAMAARRVLVRQGQGRAWGDGLAGLAPRPWPRFAPHLAERLRAGGHDGFVATTLDEDAQRQAVALLSARVTRPGSRENAAMIVVRNADRAVLAYVGGVDYLAPQGMVDMIRRPRSPGSTLKPFVYGLALDESLIVPQTLIGDDPARFGAWSPHDFDRESHGEVTAALALQQSLNVPAVRLMEAVGPARVVATLRKAGARLTLPPGAAPSLAIVLGGVGIDLSDIAMLYADLADGGTERPLALLPGETQAGRRRLVSEDAAGTVSDMLRGAPMPDGIAQGRARSVAYKTGTSYGFRDAWAAGYSADDTVAVWTGRTDGTPLPDQYGREAAAPLLFAMFDALPADAGRLRVGPPTPPPEQLAPSLRRFLPPGRSWADAAGSPSILFPPDGVVLDSLDDDGAATPVALEASGGAAPYRWFVNGRPLAAPAVGSPPDWRPAEPGFDVVTVVDARGRSGSVHLRVQ